MLEPHLSLANWKMKYCFHVKQLGRERHRFCSITAGRHVIKFLYSVKYAVRIRSRNIFLLTVAWNFRFLKTCVAILARLDTVLLQRTHKRSRLLSRTFVYSEGYSKWKICLHDLDQRLKILASTHIWPYISKNRSCAKFEQDRKAAWRQYRNA